MIEAIVGMLIVIAIALILLEAPIAAEVLGLIALLLLVLLLLDERPDLADGVTR